MEKVINVVTNTFPLVCNMAFLDSTPRCGWRQIRNNIDEMCHFESTDISNK